MVSSEAQKVMRDELLQKRKLVLVDQMRMSVGELMSLYENNEIDLSPDYQRLFRWTDEQQSDFVESILLGYPIPPIFVYQTEGGKWEVVDGVQRLSTIYRFTDIIDKNQLTEENDTIFNFDDNQDDEKPISSGPSANYLTLTAGRVLKKIDGFSWNGNKSIDQSTKLDFRRAALNIITITDKNDINPTYEVFRRLNTGGSKLSNQEIRNVLIIMSNKNAFNTMSQFCNDDIYSDLLALSKKREIFGFKMEVLSRYLVIKYYDTCNLSEDYSSNISNIDIFLDIAIEKILKAVQNIEEDIQEFRVLINFLSEHVSYDYNFRVFDKQSNKYKGGFNWLVFETIIWGLVVDHNVHSLSEFDPDKITSAIKSIIQTKDFYSKHNVTVLKSLERMIKSRNYAKEVFGDVYDDFE